MHIYILSCMSIWDFCILNISGLHFRQIEYVMGSQVGGKGINSFKEIETFEPSYFDVQISKALKGKLQ